MTEQASLDEILSAEPAAIPEKAADTTVAPVADAGASRDEQGRFAARQGAETAIPAEAAPAADAQNGGMVPQQALHAERQKNDELRRKLDEMSGQISLLARQRQEQPAPKVEQPKPKDIWEDPNGFTTDAVSKALDPVQKQISSVVFTYSKRDAVREFGADKVTAAETALQSAITGGTVNANDVRSRLSASMDPVGDVVRWHQRQNTLSRVGSDPDKFIEQEIERRLADPAEQAKLLERIRGSAQQQPNRSAPATQLPPTLARLPAGQLTGQGAQSLEDILGR